MSVLLGLAIDPRIPEHSGVGLLIPQRSGAGYVANSTPKHCYSTQKTKL